MFNTRWRFGNYIVILHGKKDHEKICEILLTKYIFFNFKIAISTLPRGHLTVILGKLRKAKIELFIWPSISRYYLSWVMKKGTNAIIVILSLSH